MNMNEYIYIYIHHTFLGNPRLLGVFDIEKTDSSSGLSSPIKG